jgi:hypothetical protein
MYLVPPQYFSLLNHEFYELHEVDMTKKIRAIRKIRGSIYPNAKNV